MGHKESGLDRLVKRLLSEKGFIRVFQENPKAYAARYRLSATQLEALLDGDEARLMAVGLSPELVQPKDPSSSWFAGALLRMGKAGAVLLAVLVAVGLNTGIAMADSPVSQRTMVRQRAGMSGRWIAHPLTSEAAEKRATHAQEGRAYYRTNVRLRRFARAQALGSYDDSDAVLAALREVDEKIGQVSTEN